jgi:hypothetical protein
MAVLALLVFADLLFDVIGQIVPILLVDESGQDVLSSRNLRRGAVDRAEQFHPRLCRSRPKEGLGEAKRHGGRCDLVATSPPGHRHRLNESAAQLQICYVRHRAALLHQEPPVEDRDMSK